jgi:hypothetical protein
MNMDEKSVYDALTQQYVKHYIQSKYFKRTLNKLKKDIKEGNNIDGTVIGEFTPYGSSDKTAISRAKEDVDGGDIEKKVFNKWDDDYNYCSKHCSLISDKLNEMEPQLRFECVASDFTSPNARGFYATFYHLTVFQRQA